MKIEHMTIDEILTRIEQGLIDEVPSDIAMSLFEEGFERGYDSSEEHGAFSSGC